MSKANLNMTLLYQIKLNASHFLPGYDGKCAVLHGHTYFIDLEIGGTPDFESGMIMDFHDVEARTNSALPDHLHFNNYIDNPTAENIAAWLFDIYDAVLSNVRVGAFLRALTVWEDPGQGVRVECA